MKIRLLIAAALLLAAAGLALAWHSRESRAQTGTIGLFTSLPILWAETDDISDLLRSDAPPHWARAQLEQRGTLVALDSLVRPDGQSALLGIKRLVLAQPRPLSPAENLALDTWVRGGGHLLLLADPMLTEETAFAIGDRRRPEDVALLSPILARWGLVLEFDPDQPLGEALIADVPINLGGRFKPTDQSAGCEIGANGISALCKIGKGRVVAMADAAVLERADPDGVRAEAFDRLLDFTFEPR